MRLSQLFKVPLFGPGPAQTDARRAGNSKWKIASTTHRLGKGPLATHCRNLHRPWVSSLPESMPGKETCLGQLSLRLTLAR